MARSSIGIVVLAAALLFGAALWRVIWFPYRLLARAEVNRRALLAVAGGDHGLDVAADVEIAHDLDPLGVEFRDEVVEDTIDDILVEDVFGAVVIDIELQRFEFDTAGVRHVTDNNRRKVGKA